MHRADVVFYPFHRFDIGFLGNGGNIQQRYIVEAGEFSIHILLFRVLLTRLFDHFGVVGVALAQRRREKKPIVLNGKARNQQADVAIIRNGR
jgi:hypothetical protein